MKFIKTDIEGLVIIEPRVFSDSRGYFFESWRAAELDAELGRHIEFVQENESASVYGVIRGLHFQKGDMAQAKLVRVVSGRVLDVALDIRPGSPTFGRYMAVELSGENHRTLFIPRGFAHGFSVLSEKVVFTYKCDNLYAPELEGGIAYNDPDLAIDWQIPEAERIISEKDLHHPLLRDVKTNFSL